MTVFMRTAALIATLGFAGVAQAQEVVLRATLAGGNVVSATESPATGEVAAVLGEDDTLQLDLIFAGLELGATGAALHTGMYNENGPAVAELDIETGASDGRLVGAELSLTPDVAADVRAGESYVVISTIEEPDGAIRGQLMPQPARLSDVPGGVEPAPRPATDAAPPAQAAPLPDADETTPPTDAGAAPETETPPPTDEDD